MTRHVPQQKPGRSKQDYSTPKDFLVAVEKRFGRIFFDLAADASNAVVDRYYDEQRNSLAQDWGKLDGTLWLNPPFARLEPWARKCAEQRDRQGWLLMLAPAAVGSNWYADHVHPYGFVLALSPRLTFVGEKMPYPKDLILVAYGWGLRGFEPWRWKSTRTWATVMAAGSR